MIYDSDFLNSQLSLFILSASLCVSVYAGVRNAEDLGKRMRSLLGPDYAKLQIARGLRQEGSYEVNDPLEDKRARDEWEIVSGFDTVKQLKIFHFLYTLLQTKRLLYFS